MTLQGNGTGLAKRADVRGGHGASHAKSTDTNTVPTPAPLFSYFFFFFGSQALPLLATSGGQKIQAENISVRLTHIGFTRLLV